LGQSQIEFSTDRNNKRNKNKKIKSLKNTADFRHTRYERSSGQYQTEFRTAYANSKRGQTARNFIKSEYDFENLSHIDLPRSRYEKNLCQSQTEFRTAEEHRKREQTARIFRKSRNKNRYFKALTNTAGLRHTRYERSLGKSQNEFRTDENSKDRNLRSSSQYDWTGFEHLSYTDLQRNRTLRILRKAFNKLTAFEYLNRVDLQNNQTLPLRRWRNSLKEWSGELKTSSNHPLKKREAFTSHSSRILAVANLKQGSCTTSKAFVSCRLDRGDARRSSVRALLSDLDEGEMREYGCNLTSLDTMGQTRVVTWSVVVSRSSM
jgi:hypothetical protein